VRVGELVTIRARLVHPFEPSQLPARPFDMKQVAVDLILAFDLEPLLVLVLDKVRRQQPREPFETRFAGLDTGLD
jgi:hypothetical protein